MLQPRQRVPWAFSLVWAMGEGFFFLASPWSSSASGSGPRAMTPSSPSEGASDMFGSMGFAGDLLLLSVGFSSLPLPFGLFPTRVLQSCPQQLLPPRFSPPLSRRPTPSESDGGPAVSLFLPRGQKHDQPGVRAVGALLTLGQNVRPLWLAGGAGWAQRIWGQSRGSVCGQGISHMCCFRL